MTAPTTPTLAPASDLHLDDVHVALGTRTLLRLSAVVVPGHILSVMGPSGSGKSSLLAFLAGFLPPAFAAGGRVRLGGADLLALAPSRRRVGLLVQDPLLFPHMSVAGNLLFALSGAVRGRQARRAAAEAILADVGLAGFGDRDPATLSGGQAARVALARTLLAEPRALLLDEPFSRLDETLRAEIRALVFARIAAGGIPALLVTHDGADAAAAGGAVLRIGAGAGGEEPAR